MPGGHTPRTRHFKTLHILRCLVSFYVKSPPTNPGISVMGAVWLQNRLSGLINPGLQLLLLLFPPNQVRKQHKKSHGISQNKSSH